MFTDQQKTQLTERSAAGEGVRAIIASMGIDAKQGLRWLKQNYRFELKTAKRDQVVIRKRVEKERADAEKAALGEVRP